MFLGRPREMLRISRPLPVYWHFRFPGTGYVYRIGRYTTERRARAAFRERFRMKRLPNGTEVWSDDCN